MARDFELINRNAFQAELNLGSTQSNGVVSVRCPHCKQLGTFRNAMPHSVSYQKYARNAQSAKFVVGMLATVYLCPNVECGGLILVIQDSSEKIWECEPPLQIDFDTSGLPPNLIATLTEAVACHASGAYRAAAMMVRRLLEEVCEASGATGANLHQRLDSLRTKVTMPVELFDAMAELKALGNDAAHVEAKTYNVIGADEASDCIELAKEILKALYQLKGLVARLQARKVKPSNG